MTGFPLQPLEAALLILLSGAAAADTTAAFQVMIGQPLVSGWLAGLILGQPVPGLLMGGALQLLWSRLTPVGAAAYPDVGPATVSGVSIAALLARSGGAGPGPDPAGSFFWDGAGAPAAILLGLVVALLAGRLGQVVTVLLRRDNARLARAADAAAGRGSYAGVEGANALGAVRSFSRGVVIPLVIVPAFLFLCAAVQHLSGRTGPARDTVGIRLFWIFGVASLLSVLWRGGRRDWGILVGGAAAGLILGRLL